MPVNESRAAPAHERPFTWAGPRGPAFGHGTIATMAEYASNELIACPECDLLQRHKTLPRIGVARCRRCDFILYREIPNSVEHVAAFALAAVILFGVGCAFPLLGLRFGATEVEATLLTGVRELWLQGYAEVSVLVLLTCVIAPLTQAGLMLYVFAPLCLGRRPWRADLVLRMLKSLQPWSMIEVFMLAVLVAMVKLEKMAIIVPGLGLWALAGSILALIAATALVDFRTVWQELERCR